MRKRGKRRNTMIEDGKYEGKKGIGESVESSATCAMT